MDGRRRLAVSEPRTPLPPADNPKAVSPQVRGTHLLCHRTPRLRAVTFADAHVTRTLLSAVAIGRAERSVSAIATEPADRSVRITHAVTGHGPRGIGPILRL